MCHEPIPTNEGETAHQRRSTVELIGQHGLIAADINNVYADHYVEVVDGAFVVRGNE